MLPQPRHAALDHGEFIDIVRPERRELDADRTIEAGVGQDRDEAVEVGHALAEGRAHGTAPDRRVAIEVVLELDEQRVRRERAGALCHVVTDPGEVDVVERDAHDVRPVDALEDRQDVRDPQVAVVLEGEADPPFAGVVRSPSHRGDEAIDEDVRGLVAARRRTPRGDAQQVMTEASGRVDPAPKVHLGARGAATIQAMEGPRRPRMTP